MSNNELDNLTRIATTLMLIEHEQGTLTVPYTEPELTRLASEARRILDAITNNT